MNRNPFDRKESKFDAEARAFRQHFDCVKNKRIAIYGIGRRTLSLLPRIKDYNIVGLLDRDPKNIGMSIENITIISIEEAEQISDMVIINSDTTNYKPIYQRICNNMLDVYYSNGKHASIEDLESNCNNDDRLWNNSYESVIKQIDLHDIISFDVFDTLLERTVANPSDVFELMEQKGCSLIDNDESFSCMRMKAVGNCRNSDPSIDEIYYAIKSECDMSDEKLGELKQCELETERRVIRPRRSIFQLFEYAIDVGKEVHIVSDMYLGKKEILELLYQYTDMKISESNIWISCEVRASKRTGEIWRLFSNKCGKDKRILHIGDDNFGDYECPIKHGIDSICVNSSIRMLALSGYRELLSEAISLEDRVVCGLLAEKLFNSPFLSGSKERQILFDAEKLGYCVYGPIMLRYFLWILESTKEIKNRRIIFLARDGFFPFEDYLYFKDIVRNISSINLPDAEYLPISRRLVLISALPDDEAMQELLRMPFMGTFKDFLFSRFNVVADERSKEYNERAFGMDSESCIEIFLGLYENEIAIELSNEKENFFKFLKEKQIMDNMYSDILMDLGCQGTNQYFLQKITHKKYYGRFFYANLSDDNSYLKECEIKACFQQTYDSKGEHSSIRKKSAFLESFFTAPYGMIRFIDRDGKIICETPKSNQKYFEVKERINSAAKTFLKDFFEIVGMPCSTINLSIIDTLYDITWSKTCCLDDETASSFYFDNDMVGSPEQNLIGVTE